MDSSSSSASASIVHHAVLVIDIGSSSIRCTAIGSTSISSSSSTVVSFSSPSSSTLLTDTTNDTVNTQSSPHPPSSSSPSYFICHARNTSSLSTTGTLEPSLVLSHVKDVIERVQLRYSELYQPSQLFITDITFACIAMSLIGTDKQYVPLTPVLTYANRDDASTTATPISLNNNVLSPPSSSRVAVLTTSETITHLREKLHISSTDLHNRTGAPLHPAYALPQIYSTIHQQEQQQHDKSSSLSIYWHSLPTWIIAQILLSSASSPSMVPCPTVAVSQSEVAWAGLFNLASGNWDTVSLEKLSINVKEYFPAIGKSNTHYTILPSQMKTDSFFSFSAIPQDGIRLWLGVGDGAAAATGSGALDSPILSLTVGTSAALRTVFSRQHILRVLCLDHPSDNGNTDTDPLSTYTSSTQSYQCPLCHRLQLSRLGLWAYQFTDEHILIGGALTDGGSLIDYIRRLSNTTMEDINKLFANQSNTDADSKKTTGIVSSLSSYSQNLFCLPFWSGERATGWNSQAKGCFYGLTYNHNNYHIICSIMEGIAFRLRAIYERLQLVLNFAISQSENKPMNPWKIIGSGAGLSVGNGIWGQIIADILQTPIEVVQDLPSSTLSSSVSLETTTLGAYMLCQRQRQNLGYTATSPPGLGNPSLKSSIIEYVPHPERKMIYNSMYNKHNVLYNVLKDIE